MAKSTSDVKPLYEWRDAVRASELPASEKFVALALSFYMDEKGGSAFPGALRLSRDTSISERHIRRVLGVLVEEGWLGLWERGGRPGGRKRANSYQAVIPDGRHQFTRDTSSPVTPAALTPDKSNTDPCPDVRPVFQETSLNPIAHGSKLSTAEAMAVLKNAIAESRRSRLKVVS